MFSGLSDESIDRIHFILFELASSNLKMAGHVPSDIFSLPVMKQFDVYLVQEDMGGCIKKTDPATISDAEKLNLDVLLVRRAQETAEILRKTGVHIKE